MNTTQKLSEQISEMRGYLEHQPFITSDVSEWSVMQQIEHVCLVSNGLFFSLNRSKGDKSADKSLKKMAFFKARFIPRGAVKAPDFVAPNPDSTPQSVSKLLDNFEAGISEVEKAPENKTSKHPLLGLLSPQETLDFVSIHTEHHLKIVREILK